MKKLLVSIYLVLYVFVNGLYANSQTENEKSIIQHFGDGIAYSIFKTAWPTAEYKDIELIKSEEIATGYEIILKFKGNSNICFMGTCPLWFKLDIITDFEFNIKDMSVLDHNAKLAAPFESAGAIAKAIANANSN